MKIFKPSELHAFLKAHGTRAKKSLSQNFLIDGNILRKIVQVAKIVPGDLVIEIGPGPGALTEALLEAGAQVIAIEMDPIFSEALQRLKQPGYSLEIVQGDALAIDLAALAKGKKAKIVANLPYHITTPLLTRALPLFNSFSSLTLMVQKEFAVRMIGKPSTPNYSSFTIFTQFYADAKLAFTIAPSCFYPPPKVHSAIMHCTLHPPPEGIEPEAFFQLTRTAFQQRRKFLRSTLQALFPRAEIEQKLSAMGLKHSARPEELSLDQFLTLFRLLRDAEGK